MYQVCLLINYCSDKAEWDRKNIVYSSDLQSKKKKKPSINFLNIGYTL